MARPKSANLGEDATDGDTRVSRVDVELVPDSGILEALCINLRAYVTGLRQVIKHLSQRHVTGSLALKSCFSFRGMRFTLPQASPLAFHWLLVALTLRRRFLARRDRSGVTTDMSCGISCNNNPLRGEISSEFDPPLVVETPSHRAAMGRQSGMICIEKIGMVRPAGWSGCGSSPTVFPSRRGGVIIGLKIGVTFESKLTIAQKLPSLDLRRTMPGKDSNEERIFKGLDCATPDPHLRSDYTLTGMRARCCTSDWKWGYKKTHRAFNTG